MKKKGLTRFVFVCFDSREKEDEKMNSNKNNLKKNKQFWGSFYMYFVVHFFFEAHGKSVKILPVNEKATN